MRINRGLVLVVLARKGKRVSILEVKGRQFELAILPVPQTEDVLQLLLSEKDIQDASEHFVLLPYAIEFALNNLPFLLVLIFHLKQLCGGSFVLPPQLDQLSSHFVNLILKTLVVVFHEVKLLLSNCSLFLVLVGKLKGG